MVVDPAPQADAIADAFGLAGAVGVLDPVPGAWSHRVYRLRIGDAEYAVKELRNPWAAQDWRPWFDEAWAFEQRAIAAGVSAPEPVLATDGSCLARVETTANVECLVRLHHWVQDAAPLAGVATRAVGEWVGATLAAMHGLRAAPVDRGVFPKVNVDNATRWASLTSTAREHGAAFADLMDTAAPTVASIAELALAAGDRLDDEVMSHADVDQKNILVAGSSLLLCDWDVASPVVPQRELADVAMSMGLWTRLDVAAHVVRAYREAGGLVRDLRVEDLGPSMMVGIDWLVMNIERALRVRDFDDAEVALGASIVPRLLEGLPGALAAARRVSELN